MVGSDNNHVSNGSVNDRGSSSANGNGRVDNLYGANHEETVLPLSMQIMRPFLSLACCENCNNKPRSFPFVMTNDATDDSARNSDIPPQQQSSSQTYPFGLREKPEGGKEGKQSTEKPKDSSQSTASTPDFYATPETLIAEYIAACHLYGCADRINAGVLTTLRFSLPAMRVSGAFHDADMLALGELLLKHSSNGAPSYITRLDFSIASREGRLLGRYGLRSHGAYTLSKVIQQSKYIEEVFLQRNRIGPYGASALFVAAANNPVLRTLVLRNCGILERGALTFAETVCQSDVCGLTEVDLSVNTIGFTGCIAIEQALIKRSSTSKHRLEIDLEGNLVLQEVMNSVTHGLGIVLALIASIMLSNRVKDMSNRHVVSCAIYSTSLIVLYTSSTLYHSFFALQATKYIFEVFDHCAIYILIAGSYTPFLQIVLASNPIWSVYLLIFIWTCSVCGIWVEAFRPTWKYKSRFTLCMYVGMGWSCAVCLPDLVEVLPQGAMNLLVMGGVAYTSGIPFFVRNNNLDHSVWHCFVLAGSICHWCGVFFYVSIMP